MRRQLTDVLGSSHYADEALKLLLAHLVSVGFGEHKRGRLRDFLLRGIRSAAKNCVAELPEGQRPVVDFDELTLESKPWVTYWREGLLERAWRALERQQHQHPEPPVYSVLFHVTSNRSAKPEEIAATIHSETGLEIDAAMVQSLMPQARMLFAQFVADEVAETLENPSGEDVKREIAQLGLGKAFSGISVVAHPV